MAQTAPAGRITLSRRRRVLFRVVAIVLALGLIEGVCALAAAVISYPRIRRASTLYAEQSEQIRELLDRRVPHLVEIDPVLGWRHTPGFPNPTNRMNAAGLRGAREYLPTPPAGVLRVAAFGDSFVYGAEVENAASWTGRIEHDNADVEVLNYGVNGYGLDQAYLRYLREGAAYSPRIVIVGFTPDDINRLVSVYRRFLSPGAALFKPRYVLGARGELVLRDVPLHTPGDYEALLVNPRAIIPIGHDDYWYQPCVYENPLHDYSATVRVACAAGGQIYRRYLDPDRPFKGGILNVESTAFKIQAALFRGFSGVARERGARSIVVMLPDKKTLDRIERGAPAAYEPLMAVLRDDDIPFADASEALLAGAGAGRNFDALFAEGGHYSAAGNARVGTWLTGKLRTLAGRPR